VALPYRRNGPFFMPRHNFVAGQGIVGKKIEDQAMIGIFSTGLEWKPPPQERMEQSMLSAFERPPSG
jgi:hypothetical protein